MKSILFVILLTIGLYAQNYSCGKYYSQEDYIEDVQIGFAYYNYGYPVYKYKHAEWHSSYGTRYVYVWNGYNWAYQQQTGSYYWYNWSYYYSY